MSVGCQAAVLATIGCGQQHVICTLPEGARLACHWHVRSSVQALLHGRLMARALKLVCKVARRLHLAADQTLCNSARRDAGDWRPRLQRLAQDLERSSFFTTAWAASWATR